MSRVISVKKAQKEQGRCGKCGDIIAPGSPYRWWKPSRFGSRHVRCAKSECTPRSSETEGNSKRATIMQADEDLQDAISTFRENGDVEELKAAFSDCAQAFNDVRDEYQESYDNMEQAFPGGCPTMEEIQEKMDALEASAEELEQWEPSESEADLEGAETDEEKEEREEHWRNNTAEEAEDVDSSCPF